MTDIPIAHLSCSKQHAAIQYRQISEKNEFGEVSTSVKWVHLSLVDEALLKSLDLGPTKG